MDKIYLEKLPTDIRSLVEEIEDGTHIEIEVQVDASRDKTGTLACEVDQHSAKILTPKAEYFPDGSVLHELLHIRRFLLEDIPRIIVCDDYEHWTPQLDKGLTDLDNRLEHLIIVSEELKIRPSRRKHWGHVMQCVLRDIGTAAINEEDRKRYSLLNWIFVHYALRDDNLSEQAWLLITQLCVSEQAEKFNKALISSLDSKEHTVRVCFEHLDIPFDVASLEYLNSRDCTSQVIPLTKISGRDST